MCVMPHPAFLPSHHSIRTPTLSPQTPPSIYTSTSASAPASSQHCITTPLLTPTHTLAPALTRPQMSTLLAELSDAPSAAILDGLRGLERKTSLVFTLLKASVYSIVLNQQIQDGGEAEGESGERWEGRSEG